MIYRKNPTTSKDDFFIADFVFVKYKFDEFNDEIIDDIIIIESKLKRTTDLTTPQKEAVKIDNYINRNKILKESIKIAPEVENRKLKISENLIFNGEKKWYKISNGERGEFVENIDKINENGSI